MPESERFSAHEFLEWDSAAEVAGRLNAERLADVARRRSGQPARVDHAAIQSVGICGAGIMGAAIAAANVRHAIPVQLYDASHSAIDRAVQAVREEIAAVAANIDPHPPARSLLHICSQQDDLAGCDLVIESVVENRELKQRILEQLARRLAPDAILATNTSTLGVSELGNALHHPGRFCGLHFCNPVSQRPLVEIVRGQSTSDETLAKMLAYAVRIGKLPIVVRDSPGFLINRLLLPYLNEALELVCRGVDLQQIDRVARQFGMAMGPIELLDLIGTDTAMWAGRTLWEAYPDRIALTPVLPALVKRGRLGQKTGCGFYRYTSPNGAGKRDPDLRPILAPYVRRPRDFSTSEITQRLFLPMLIEATRAIEERVITDVRDVDIGLLFGLGFPKSRGGLLSWADQIGVATIVTMLRRFESLGKRMQPTELLLSYARTGKTFYD